ncbi:hypothetical protein H9P43_002207 [Blastocladiella emersonii ATCC 22665]|nr:hypothetical protein H9P43_002207 [Blastocladiella emersonii ATCC 22665]
MRITEQGRLAVALDRLHLYAEGVPYATVRLTLGAHREESFHSAYSPDVLANLRLRARSHSQSRSRLASTSSHDSASAAADSPRSRSKSKSGKSRSRSRRRGSVPPNSLLATAAATIGSETDDPVASNEVAQAAVEELARLVAAHQHARDATGPPPTLTLDLPAPGSSKDLFDDWRASVMRTTGAEVPSARTSVAASTPNATEEPAVADPAPLEGLSFRDVAIALSEIDADDGYGSADGDDYDDEEYDDEDDFSESGNEDEPAPASTTTTTATVDLASDRALGVPALEDLPETGSVFNVLGSDFDLPLTLHAFLYDSIKVSVLNNSGRSLAKCKLRIKSVADPGDPGHPMSVAAAHVHAFHLVDRADHVVGSLRLRMCALWNDAISAAPEGSDGTDAESIRTAAAGAAPSIHGSIATESERTVGSRRPHLPLLARTLTRGSMATINSFDTAATYGGSLASMPGTPMSEQVPVDPRMSMVSRRSMSAPVTTSSSASAKSLPATPAGTSLLASSSSASLHGSFQDDAATWARSDQDYTKLHALREMVRLGKAFFGEGWGMAKSDMLGALLLLRKWGNHPARRVSRPRAPLHYMCPDLEVLRHLQRNFRYSLASYGQIGLNFFGYGHGRLGYLVDTVASSDRSMLLSLLGIQDQDILIWDMTRTGATAAPHFYCAHVPEDSTIVLCVRGTMNIEDTLTDLMAHMEPFLSGATHAGFRRCAEYVFTRALPELRAALATHRPRRLLVTGHSLGGATAQLVAMLLRTQAGADLRFLACGSDPDPAAFKIECLTYAAPPTVTPDLAAQFPDFCNVVNDTDIVPRLSYGSVMDFKHMLVTAAEQLTPTGAKSTFAARVGARLGLFRENALNAQMAALDQARISLGGITPLADHNGVVRAGSDATAASSATSAAWTPAHMDAGAEVNVKLVGAGTAYYLMRSDAHLTRASPDPISGKVRVRRVAKPHVECWVAPAAAESPFGARPKLAMLDIAVASGALLNHTPDGYDRAIARAILWAEKCAAGDVVLPETAIKPAMAEPEPLVVEVTAVDAAPSPTVPSPIIVGGTNQYTPPPRSTSRNTPTSPVDVDVAAMLAAPVAPAASG